MEQLAQSFGNTTDDQDDGAFVPVEDIVAGMRRELMSDPTEVQLCVDFTLSHLIVSYLISSYFILYLILPYLTLSYLILSYLILSYLILSYLVLSCLVLSCLILSHHTIVTSYPASFQSLLTLSSVCVRFICVCRRHSFCISEALAIFEDKVSSL
jgi:hypothetical protein